MDRVKCLSVTKDIYDIVERIGNVLRTLNGLVGRISLSTFRPACVFTKRNRKMTLWNRDRCFECQSIVDCDPKLDRCYD